VKLVAQRRFRSRGLAIVTFSLVAAVLVPLAGLAMDGAMLCVVKERLTTAVDAAALAASHHPEKGPKMQSAIKRFLDSNFPEGYMGTGSRKVSLEGDQLEVRVEAQTYFLKLLHIRNVEVVAAHHIGA
jgi:Flp pilus assembly protein TadG